MLTIVFDLDGTLADTSGDLLAAANTCFVGMGHGEVLKSPRDNGAALRGGRAMLSAGLKHLGLPQDEALMDQWYPRLLEAYGENIDRHTVLYPGAIEAVRKLADLGHPVAICTNKPEKLACQLLQNLGVIKDFHSIIGADTLPVRKPDPEPMFEAVRRAGGDPSQAVLVGDTITDLSTAQAAGAYSILVTFGPDDNISDLKPDVFLDHFGKLPDIIQDLNRNKS